jgi:AcrR family transcriptional regulator
MDLPEPTPTARDALLRAAREELAERGHAAVSLRAVARRAGVSHAAPAHFFGDRAGMLTAVAVDGFDLLDARLQAAARDAETAGESPLAALGLAYVDFGLAEPALSDLMFRRAELAADDPRLLAARRRTLGRLREAVGEIAGAGSADWSLIAWALAHGLVSLAREGVLAPMAGRGDDEAADLARDLVVQFASGFRAAG